MTSRFDFLSVKSNSKDLVNDPSAIYTTTVENHEVNYAMLWNIFKRSPEVVAIITAIVEDILSDGWILEGGRNNKKKAEEFLTNTNAKEELSAFLFDAFVTGDGYLYKLKADGMEVKSIIQSVLKMLPTEFDDFEMKAFETELYQKAWSDGTLATRRIKALPSSTIKIRYKFRGGEIEYYEQNVAGIRQRFSPDEIIHFRNQKVNGKVYGWTPMVSILQELSILQNVKDYADYYFSVGGMPNMMYILEDETPDSPNYKRFISQMNTFTNVKAKFKSMALTGKITVEKLNEMNKDMEFKELAKYVTQIIVLAWNMPASRLSDLLVEKGVQGATATEGYYRKISHVQDRVEDLLNANVLNDFDVKLRFKRAYKQDEVREVQIEKIKSDVCEQRLSLGLVTKDWCWRYLNIPEDDQPDEDEIPVAGSKLMNQDTLNNHQVLANSEKLAADQKRQDSMLEKTTKNDMGRAV